MSILDKIHNVINKFFDRLFSYDEEKKFIDPNLDPSFYLKERNYHEDQIMEINDFIQQLEEERSKHEYFFNVADTMYSKLIQKGN